MRTTERANRELMRDHATGPLARKLAVEVKRGRFDPEQGLAQMFEVEVYRVVGSRTDRRRYSDERRRRRAMNMSGGDHLHARMRPDN